MENTGRRLNSGCGRCCGITAVFLHVTLCSSTIPGLCGQACSIQIRKPVCSSVTLNLIWPTCSQVRSQMASAKHSLCSALSRMEMLFSSYLCSSTINKVKMHPHPHINLITIQSHVKNLTETASACVFCPLLDSCRKCMKDCTDASCMLVHQRLLLYPHAHTLIRRHREAWMGD